MRHGDDGRVAGRVLGRTANLRVVIADGAAEIRPAKVVDGELGVLKVDVSAHVRSAGRMIRPAPTGARGGRDDVEPFPARVPPPRRPSGRVT